MTNDEELKLIKKQYGEKFMHFCRRKFPLILNNPGSLWDILNETFDANCKEILNLSDDETYIGDQIISIIESKTGIDKEEKKMPETDKSPFELLIEKGYTLVECKTNKELKQFSKYYEEDEILCTITEGDRVDEYHCFWAIKDDWDTVERGERNVREGKRLYYPREDAYGQSVIAIQFSKKNGNCQIISRYNHSASNPNGMFNGNLEKIAEGLTFSFGKFLDKRYDHEIDWESHINTGEYIPGLVRDISGKYYQYNIERNGIYYCPGNIIIKEGEVTRLGNEKGTVILADYFKIDTENKTIELIDEAIDDSFLDTIGEIDKIKVENDKKNKVKIIKIYSDGEEIPIEIEIDEKNQIVGYDNQYIESTGDGFMRYNIALRKLNCPYTTEIGDDCLSCNQGLKIVNFPEVERVGNRFMEENEIAEEVHMPKVKSFGDDCLSYNQGLKIVNFPEVERVGNRFMEENEIAEEVHMPKVKSFGDFCFHRNKLIHILDIPQIEELGDYFCCLNTKLDTFNYQNLRKMGISALDNGINIESFIAPKLEELDSNILWWNHKLKEINLNSLRKRSRNMFHGVFGDNIPKVKDFRGKGTVQVEELKRELEERKEKSIVEKVKRFFRAKLALRKALEEGTDIEDVEDADKQLNDIEYEEKGNDREDE